MAGLLVLALFTVLGGVIGVRLARTRGAVWLLVGLILAAPLYVFFLQDRLVLARALPWPGVFFVGNGLALPLTATLAGLAAPRLTRRWLLVPLLIGALYQALGPLLGAAPSMDSPQVSGGVVMQTSAASCSAASAATLLRHAGVPATEEELARLCFTRSSGTPMLGAFHGLALKAPGRVRVLSRASVGELRRACKTGPVLLSVGLDRWQRGYDPRYVNEWGWTPGKRHAVVLFGFLPGGKIDIGDPSVGRETWSEESLQVLWNGEGVQLAR
jgi:hypothetical protein